MWLHSARNSPPPSQKAGRLRSYSLVEGGTGRTQLVGQGSEGCSTAARESEAMDNTSKWAFTFFFGDWKRKAFKDFENFTLREIQNKLYIKWLTEATAQCKYIQATICTEWTDVKLGAHGTLSLLNDTTPWYIFWVPICKTLNEFRIWVLRKETTGNAWNSSQ
jgi:hypothetical protein